MCKRVVPHFLRHVTFTRTSKQNHVGGGLTPADLSHHRTYENQNRKKESGFA